MSGRACGVDDAVNAGSAKEGGHKGAGEVDSAMEDGSERAGAGTVRFADAAEEPSTASEVNSEPREAPDANLSSCKARWEAPGLVWLAEQSSRAKRSRSAAPGETVGSPKMASTSKTWPTEVSASPQRAQQVPSRGSRGSRGAAALFADRVTPEGTSLRARCCSRFCCCSEMAGWSAGHWLDIWHPRSDFGAVGSHWAGITYLRQ